MSSLHLAVLIGPRAHKLRDVLREVVPTLQTRLVADVYAIADGSALEESDSWWIDHETLDERGLGALEFSRRLRPDVLRVLLAEDLPDGHEAAEDDVTREARALGLRIVHGAPPLATLRRLLNPDEGEDDSPEHAVIAGIADQIANPLAALAARLQLCEIALGSSADVDFEDNLALARETTQRIATTLEKLRLMTAHGSATRGAHAIVDILRGVLVQGGSLEGVDPKRVRLPELADQAPLEAWVDPSIFEQAIAAILRTSLDLSPDGLEVVAYDRATSALLELRFESPLAAPNRRDGDVFAPFALNKTLRDPDLGLDLALGRALIRTCGGSITALRHAGFLEGFEIRLPSPPAPEAARDTPSEASHEDDA